MNMLMGLPGVNGRRDAPMLKRILTLFISETDRNVGGIVDGAAAGDTAAVQRLAHKMKSACLAMGAVQLGVRARALDERMKAGVQPDATDAARLTDAWDACKRRLVEEGLASLDEITRVEGPINP